MSSIAIIPARGGSKRIPRKNIKSFLGEPIISYSIEIALKSNLFDEVMVSTDDSEIAELSVKLGAKVPFLRSEETANDFASTLSVVQEVVQKYKSQFKTFDYACCIYPTAPLIQVKHLVQGCNRLIENSFDSVFPVIPFSYPIWRGFELFEDKAKMLWPEFKSARSQDLKQVFHDAGQWYWLNLSKIDNSIITSNSGVVVLSEMEAQDIDNLSDWKIAEMKYRMLNEKKDLH